MRACLCLARRRRCCAFGFGCCGGAAGSSPAVSVWGWGWSVGSACASSGGTSSVAGWSGCNGSAMSGKSQRCTDASTCWSAASFGCSPPPCCWLPGGGEVQHASAGTQDGRDSSSRSGWLPSGQLGSEEGRRPRSQAAPSASSTCGLQGRLQSSQLRLQVGSKLRHVPPRGALAGTARRSRGCADGVAAAAPKARCHSATVATAAHSAASNLAGAEAHLGHACPALLSRALQLPAYCDLRTKPKLERM